MKYIDAERLRARIKKNLAFDNSIDTAYYKGRRDAEWDILTLIDSLQQEQPAEWSEEDEKMRNKIVGHLSGFMYPNSLYEEDAIECIDWLKSLRPQPHWEPSEEQMTELFHALIPGAEYDCDILEELYFGLRSWLDSIHNQQK